MLGDLLRGLYWPGAVALGFALWISSAAVAQARLPPVEEEVPAEWDIVPETVAPKPPPRAEMAGGPMGMGGPGGGGPSLYAYFQPASDLRGQPGTFASSGAGVTLGAPIRKGEDGIWILNTRFEHQSFETEANLPGRPEAFPDALMNINVSLMNIRPLENGWTAGGMIGVGSASDEPFASVREMNLNFLAFLNVPVRERDAWNFSLMYSPLGQLAFPIPGIAYAWRPSEQFQMSIGLPFSMTYRPTETLTFNLSYLPLTTVNATAKWTPDDLWTVYGGYQTRSQGYQLADRSDDEERLFQFDQRLMVGVRRSLGYGFGLDLSAAYLFDRSYFLSDSFFGGGSDRLRIDPGASLMLKIDWMR